MGSFLQSGPKNLSMLGPDANVPRLPAARQANNQLLPRMPGDVALTKNRYLRRPKAAPCCQPGMSFFTACRVRRGQVSVCPCTCRGRRQSAGASSASSSGDREVLVRIALPQSPAQQATGASAVQLSGAQLVATFDSEPPSPSRHNGTQR